MGLLGSLSTGTGIFDTSEARADEEAGVRVVGELRALTGCTVEVTRVSGGNDRFGPCPLLVDDVRSLGLTGGTVNVKQGFTPVDENWQGENGGGGPELRVYDLERLTVVGRKRFSECPTNSEQGHSDADWVKPLGAGLADQGNNYAPCGMLANAAMDTQRSLLWAPLLVQTGNTAARANCFLVRHDYRVPASIESTLVEYDSCPRRPPYPATGLSNSYPGGGGPTAAGPRPLVHLFVTRSSDDALYATGTFEEEGLPRRPTTSPPSASFPGPADFGFENLGQSLIVRRLIAGAGGDGRALQFHWDLDLRGAGCGRRVGWHPGEPRIRPFVARVGDDLLAYCWDPRPAWWSPFPMGDQGYLVRIPLVDDRPVAPQGQELAVDPTSGAYVNYRYVRTPTLPGYLDVTFDPGTNRVLLVTDGPPNGNAVWVFDPDTDRFVGTATGGFAAQPRDGTAVGIDPVRSRVYLTTQDGLLMFRTKPLSSGLLFPVAQNIDRRRSFVNYRLLAVAPRARRIFVPINFPDQRHEDGANSSVNGARWLVLEDAYPDALLSRAPNPDAATTQIDEGAATGVVAGGQALASGAHVVVTGGLARTIDQTDPACRTEVPAQIWLSDSESGRHYVGIVLQPEQGEVKVESGSDPREAKQQFAVRDGTPSNGWQGTGFRPFGSDGCAADQVIKSGHRELFLGATEAEAGSNVGAVARAGGLSFGPTDVTDGDVRNLGACGRGTMANLLQGNDPGRNDDGTENGFAEGCDDFHDGVVEGGGPDLREGTQGADDRGFPIPASVCGDFGGSPGTDARGGNLEGEGPASLFHSSRAECNAATTYAKAEATAAALTISSDPVVSVARTQSALFSVKHPDRGQVTVAWASAQGVRIGPLLIREVKSLAITEAHGRNGTAKTRLLRVWCGLAMVTGAEDDPTTAGREGPIPLPGQGCVDPARDPGTRDMIASLNQQLTKVRLSVPPANGDDGVGEATPGGYQAVVTKDPDVRAGDQAVNHDDTHTVPALEIVVYNDGAQGLNRVVVQLAGVHAESRYGVFELPTFNGGDFGGGGGGGGTSGPSEPSGALVGAPPVAPEAGAGVFTTPESFFVEDPAVFETVRFSPPPPSRPLVTLPESDGRLPRLIEVPVRVLRDAIELLVQHPREFGLLFVLFSLLAAPLYLGSRRRSFASAIAAGS